MGETYTFLLVEDSEEDAMLLRLAFARAKIPNPIQVVTRGEEAVAYLTGSGRYADRQKHPVPALIFLDLNLPGIGGVQVLEWLRDHVHLRHIRVVVLSSSPDMRLFSKVIELGADHLFGKTHDYKDLISFVQSFSSFTQMVQPPPATGMTLPLA